jgi:hypothetical protein
MPASAMTKITSRIDPVGQCATALSLAADRLQRGQAPGLDLSELERLLDQGLEVLLRERRAEILRHVAIQTRHCAGDMQRLFPGETAYCALRCAAEVVGIRHQLALVKAILEHETGRTT